MPSNSPGGLYQVAATSGFKPGCDAAPAPGMADTGFAPPCMPAQATSKAAHAKKLASLIVFIRMPAPFSFRKERPS